MPNVLAMLLAFLGPQAQQPPAAAPAAQEEAPPEIKWKLGKDDKFDLKWTYSQTTHMERGGNPPLDTSDRRDVEAELLFKETAMGPALRVKFKKAVWTLANKEYDLIITHSDGKPTAVQVKVKFKDDPKAPLKRVPIVQADAERFGDEIKKVFSGEYTILPNPQTNDSVIQLDGSNQANTASIFGKCYLQSKPPSGSVSQGQGWKEPLTGVSLPSGLVDVDAIDYKVTTVGKSGITVKAGFQTPIKQVIDAAEQNITGSYTYGREYTFSRDYHLANSKEEAVLRKKVTAKVKFYDEDTSLIQKQEMTIKKRPPPKEAAPAPEKK